MEDQTNFLESKLKIDDFNNIVKITSIAYKRKFQKNKQKLKN